MGSQAIIVHIPSGVGEGLIYIIENGDWVGGHKLDLFIAHY